MNYSNDMRELIPVSYDNPERPTVSGRELHDFLEIKTAYKDWFPRMCEYGFTEGEDFNPLRIERVQDEGGRMVSRTVDDHQLTIPMAKELCMIQRNERGKQARQYFLAVEAKWNSPEAVMRRPVGVIRQVLRQGVHQKPKIHAVPAQKHRRVGHQEHHRLDGSRATVYL